MTAVALRDDLAAIAADATLSDDVKKALIAAHVDEAKAAAENAAATAALHDTRRSRWEIPLWVALTGLITFGAQSVYDWIKTGERTAFDSGQAALDRQQERQTKEAEAAATQARLDDEQQFQQNQERLKFQYDVLRSELAKFTTAADRAASLNFLIRAGIVGEPLDKAELERIIAESANNPAALPPVGATLPATSFSYTPCQPGPAAARLTADALRRIAGIGDSATPKIDLSAASAALGAASAGIGACDAESLSAVVATAVYETAGLQFLEARNTRLPPPIRKALGNLSEADDAIFAGRGFAMVTGRRNYAWLAETLSRPDLLDNPGLLSTDPELAAQSLAAFLRRSDVLAACLPGPSCDALQLRRRMNGGITGLSGFKAILDRARAELSGTAAAP